MKDNILPYGNISTVVKLGQAVRIKRKADGLTQAKAAALCGVGVRFVSDLENGKLTVELGKALLVLNGLGLSIDIRPKGLNKRYAMLPGDSGNKSGNNQIQKNTSHAALVVISDTYVGDISKLADSYKESLRSIDKILKDVSKHRNDYLSLGISPNAYNDIVKSYKHIHDATSSVVSSLSNARFSSPPDLKNLSGNKLLDSLSASVGLNKDVLAGLDSLKSKMTNLNLNTKATEKLQRDYKKNFNNIKLMLKKIARSLNNDE